MMDKEAWHYKVWKTWSNRVYANSLNRKNFYDDGRVHQQDQFFEVSDGFTTEHTPPNTDDTYYFKMKKDNVYYIVPKRFKDDFPFIPLKYLEVKLREKDSQLWRLVMDIQAMKIPKKKFHDNYKSFIDDWNPLQHSDSTSWTFQKILAQTNSVKCAICSPVGNGKNSNMILMRSIRRNIHPKVKVPTRAAFYYTIYHNQHINIDEITSWSATDVRLIEELCVDIADDDPDLTKFSMDRDAKMMKTDLELKGLTFTFNPITDKNRNTFESRFKNADKILDRYPVFMLGGRVTDQINEPNILEIERLIAENLQDIQRIVAEEHYWREEYPKHLHGWDNRKCPFKYRHYNNMKSVLDKLDVYSETQAEFDDWMLWLRDRREDYRKMVDSEGNGSVIEEFVE